MSEMVDRVKRAIKFAGDIDAAAVSVIEEMRVPTPEMLAAAARLPPAASPLDVWKAMILAAR